MPKINKIRIINFKYNNGSRHIADETFQFYGGENGLLSLSNGGGKSVLVQTFLQPILPKTTLLKRKISGFFKGERKPAYIMIEWELDNNDGFLTTGICLSPKYKRTTDEYEEFNDVNYYTFTSFYTAVNQYDISSMPFTTRVKGGIEIKGYKESREYIKNKAKNMHIHIDYYSSESEDRSAYKKKLESFFIFPNEWKQLIKEINENEHGLNEVFSNCKTSQTIMSRWILKQIEKQINEENNEIKTLQDLLRKISEEIIKKESSLKEKEIVTRFTKVLEAYQDKLNVLFNSKLSEEQVLDEIYNLFGFIIFKTRELEKSKDKLISKLDENKQALHDLKIEELSFEYYKLDAKFNKIINDLKVLTEKIENNKIEKKLFKEKIDNLEAAETYGEIKKLEADKLGYIERLSSKELSNKEIQEKINNNKYSLKIKYSDNLEKVNKDISNISDINLKHESNMEKLNEKIKNLRLQREVELINNNNFTRLIDEFILYEKEINDKHSFNILRNLNNELNNDDLIRIEKDIANEIKEFNNNIEETNKEITRFSLDNDRLEDKIKNNNEELLNLKNKKNKLDLTYDKFSEEKGKQQSILIKYNISTENIYKKIENTNKLKEKILDWKINKKKVDASLESINSIIKGIKDNCSFVPFTVMSRLKEYGIEVITGEEYLKNQPKERVEELIKRNKVLPYSIITSQKEIEKIKDIDIDININKLIPITRYDSKYNDLDIDFLCNYDTRLFDVGEIKKYTEELALKKNEKELELKHIEENITEINKDLIALEQFNFTRDDEKNLIENITSINNEIQKLNQLNEINTDIIEKNKSSIDELNSLLAINNEKLEYLKSKEIDFNQYIEKNDEYIENLSNNNRAKESLHKLKIEIEENEKIVDDIKDKISDNKRKIDNLRQLVKSYEKELIKYLEINEGTFIDKDINELEKTLEELLKGIPTEIKDLNDKIEKCKNDIQIKTNKLNNLNIPLEKYENIVYDFEERKNAKDKVKELEAKLDDQNEEKLKLEKLKTKIETKKDNINKQIIDLNGTLFEKSDILLNFKERKKVINNAKNQLEKELNQTDTFIREYIRNKDRINDSEYVNIQEAKIVENYKLEKESISKETQYLINLLKSHKKETSENLKKISRFYGDVKNSFTNKLDSINKILIRLDVKPDLLNSCSNQINLYGINIENSIETINKIMDVILKNLENLEESKNNFINHTFKYALEVYGEIAKIEYNSSVKLENDRYIRMLQILIDKKSDDENILIEKMTLYIDDITKDISKSMKENNNNISDINKRIERYVSTEELLRVITDYDRCRVKAYKIDINKSNRRYINWEDVIINNSGGEKFVVFFTLLIALISYSRSLSNVNWINNKNSTKVLIMDNPFGAITSGHLLKPVFEIAEKYNTQLICLSDIKQSTVLEQFKLVYMIKIMQSSTRKGDYLKIEKIENEIISDNEILEKAKLYFETTQTSMF